MFDDLPRAEGSSPRVRGKRPDPLAHAVDEGLIPARAGKTTAWARGSSAASAHPRACGENPLSSSSFARGSGSSPRVRGKRRPLPHRRRRGRLIPARAGKTSRPRRPPPSRPAHPRACGENLRIAWPVTVPAGSSPRVRGKQGAVGAAGLPERIIPARAGKTRHWRPVTPPTRDHPRACGENWAPWTRVSTLWGSSPRVRGKLLELLGDPGAAGIIPARAGKTADRHYTASLTTDHPRACGENVTWDPAIADRPGSSPRVRGKHAFAPWDDCPAGIIPARAGKTSRTTSASGSATDHPRACGENALPWSCSEPPLGSSPRVRGKPCAGAGRVHLPRLIPARAGKTWSGVSQEMRRSAHPRACGENPADLGGEPGDGGSSPRVRGKQSACSRSEARRRLIPARAGKTRPARPKGAARPAHPRACGENLVPSYRSQHREGSSPRVRGKRASRPSAPDPKGLIPARAGKTGALDPRPAPPRAHPRACGENSARAPAGSAHAGSSPRVRGKRFLTWAFTARVGRILETLEPSAFSGSYSFPGARANGGQCRARRRGLCTGPALGRALGAS